MNRMLLEPKHPIPKERQRFSNQDLFRLITPIIIEQLLMLLVGIADTLMVSYVSEAAVSGTSLVNQVNNIFIFIFGALASGGAVIASQYVGRGDKNEGAVSASQLMMITTLTAIVCMLIALCFRREILNLLFGRVEADVMDAALTYLVLSAVSFPALAVYNSGAALFRSMNRTKTVMYVSLVMNVINVAGNAIGVFVLNAGVAGVAVPSIISRTFAAAVLFLMLLNEKNALVVRVRDIFRWDGGLLKQILHVSLPNGVENGLFQISKVAISSVVAMFGTIQIAANGVAQSFWSMAALFAIAMGYAFVTVIGQCMGAGDVEAADYYNKKLLRITYLGTVLWNALFFACTPLLLKLYDLSSETKELIVILVLLHNTFNALLCPVAFSLSNGLRAAGDVHFTMMASIFATVICRVAFTYLFGVVMNLGVIGVTMAMCADWVVKAVLVLWRYHSRKWTKFQVI